MNHYATIVTVLLALIGQVSVVLALIYRMGRRSARLEDSVIQIAQDFRELKQSVQDDFNRVNDRLTWLERQRPRARW
jgi:hypothetical protein